MRYYFKKYNDKYIQLDVNSFTYEKYEWEREMATKDASDMIIRTDMPEMVEKIMNRSVDVVQITCYGTTELMVREEATLFYLKCMRASEGAERDRYTNIYFGLLDGLNEIRDEDF